MFYSMVFWFTLLTDQCSPTLSCYFRPVSLHSNASLQEIAVSQSFPLLSEGGCKPASYNSFVVGPFCPQTLRIHCAVIAWSEQHFCHVDNCLPRNLCIRFDSSPSIRVFLQSSRAWSSDWLVSFKQACTAS